MFAGFTAILALALCVRVWIAIFGRAYPMDKWRRDLAEDLSWAEIDDGLAHKMPADGEIVELKLKTGRIIRAMFWYGGPDEWDFVSSANGLGRGYLKEAIGWRSLAPN